MNKAEMKTRRGPSRTRRRRYVVDSRLQWKYALLASLAVLITSGTMSFLVHYLQFRQTQARILSSDWTTAENSTAAVALTAAILGVAIAACAGLTIIFVTHRICGPIYVLRSSLDELVAGRFPKRRSLRRKDELTDLHDHFFKAVETLEAEKTFEQTVLQEVAKSMREIAEAAETPQRARLERAISRLDSLCERAAAAKEADQHGAAIQPHPAEGQAATGASEYKAAHAQR